MHPIIGAALVLAMIGWAVFSLLTKKKEKMLDREMPGPALVPLIGRIHDLPIQYMWNKFMEWGQTYGPIYRTEMLGARFVIISDESIAEELLVKRAKIYSDRPVMRSLFDSKSSEGSMEYLPLMGRNKYWARQRQWTHAQYTEAGNSQYYGIMEHEAKRWLYRLATNPDDFINSLEDMASKIMCTLTWDTPEVSEYNTKSAWGLLTQMSPAGPISNVITPLWTHIPSAINPWKIAERKRHDEQNAWWMKQLLQTRKKMEEGTQRPCWAVNYIQNAEKQKLSGDAEASCCIGMACLVGVFTVAGPLYYFLIAMVKHQDWLKKAQEELDSVCGNRPPTLDDYPNLPVLRACIKETLRWRPNVPTGVAHEVEEDDFYNGWLIPKGSRILPLDIAFMRNPKKYPDPEKYRPERWLESSWPTYQEPLTEFPTTRNMTSFGFGRRQCLGRHITQDELLIACGALCWAFNLKYKVDPATGEDIPIDDKKSNSLLIIKPDPYEMAFEPRSEERRQLVLDLWLASEKEFDLARDVLPAEKTSL